MNRAQRMFLTCLCAGICVLAAASAVVAAPAEGDVAAMDVSAARIDWRPLVEYERLVLTVSGPGDVLIQRQFARGEVASFDLFDAKGNQLPSGSYAYQLEAVAPVSPDVQKRLAAARERGDAAAAERLVASGRARAGGIQAGTFAIHEGSFVTPGLTEPRSPDAARRVVAPLNNVTAADQVIADDLIVQNSLCVGFDCVNGEVFGFDTIRLKENNTRIKFEDTSVGTFPSNDWQLTANDSASGGQNKFSIEDITGVRVPFTIEAGSTTNSVYVDSTGRVGFRTSTPVLDIHIATGNTPGIRLEQNSSGGFSAQSWDISGNETNFFIRDVTGGSLLPFRIRPGASTSSIDINSDGEVGIGTASPTQELTIKSDTGNENVVELQRSAVDNQVIFRIFESAAGAGLISLFDEAANEDFRLAGTGGANWLSGTVGINCNAAGGFDFAVKSGTSSTTACNTGTFSGLTAGATQFSIASSRTMKENLEPVRVPDILEKMAAVDVYTYDFITGPKNILGLVAEDFHTVFGRGSDKMINGQEVEMALWLAVKELSARNQELQTRNSELASTQQKLEAELGRIKEMLQGIAPAARR